MRGVLETPRERERVTRDIQREREGYKERERVRVSVLCLVCYQMLSMYLEMLSMLNID